MSIATDSPCAIRYALAVSITGPKVCPKSTSRARSCSRRFGHSSSIMSRIEVRST